MASPRRSTYQISVPNLGLDLMRATEAAAMAAGAWTGRGDPAAGDRAAHVAMREVLNEVTMNGFVIIGETDHDTEGSGFTLQAGDRCGTGSGAPVDVAVDPVEGTVLLADGRSNAISVIAASDRGTMYDPSVVTYMEKLVVGADAAEAVDLDAPIADTIVKVAKAKGVSAQDVTVGVLHRPRHEQLISEIRATEAKIRLFNDGDVAMSIAAAEDGRSCDMMVGTGGSPEGVITACAMKAMDGTILARLHPKDDEEREKAQEAGLTLDTVLSTDDLINGGHTYFVATGITDGDLLPGVRYFKGGTRTASIVMRSRSGTVRHVESVHRTDKVGKHTQE